MNIRVRSYLIEVARQKEKFVYYSDVVKDCDLEIDTNTDFGRHQLSELLGKISEFENNQQPPRPLLSSLAIYKDKNKNDHGNGFYKIAEQLGKGSFKSLKENLFAFSESNECREFWQKDENYKKFGTIINNERIPTYDIEFFKHDELEFFKKWQNQAYDPTNLEHFNAKNFLMDTVWKKSIYLGNEIKNRLQDFELSAKRSWSQRGWVNNDEGSKVRVSVIKPYTWIKIFRNTDRGKDIFFTFGVDAHPEAGAFIYKIDCQDKRDSKLSQSQIELCKSLIPETAKWNKISFDNLISNNWDTLIDICINFIQAHIEQYDTIIEAVWGGVIPPALFNNKLIKQEKPKNGYESIPELRRNFNEVDIDFQQRAKDQKDLGNIGEGLVLQREIDFLRKNNRHDKAGLVKIVKDGRGYDVLSFDKNGNEKYIEVKTTKGNEYTPFYLSENEIEFMRLNPNQYSIYRLYNFDESNTFAEFFELSGDIESQLLMKPIEYKVLLKKED